MTSTQRFLSDTWAALGEILALMFGAFGGPAEVASRIALPALLRQHILDWLGPLEALARRLLAIEAMQLPIPNVAPPATAARVAGLGRDLETREGLPEDPQAWRVTFAVWPGGRRRESAPNECGARRRHHVENAEPLARRMEALLRVFRDRPGAVQRLARLLAARRGSAYAAFPNYRGRLRVGPADTCLAETQAVLDPLLMGFTYNTS